MMKYDTYKDSGIEWLGEIPDSWDVTRFKDIFNVSQGLQIARSSRFFKQRKNSVRYITIPSIEGKVEEYIDKPSKNVICTREEILVVRTGSGVGKILINLEGAFHNNFFKAKPKNKESRDFIYCVLISPQVQYLMNIYAGLTAIPDLNHGEFYSIYCVLPPLPEQKTIAQYLDTKTQAIDKKISLLQKKIDYYTELRISIINDAVTKGLDKNVELKDSDIDWIGQIPKHWAITRVKDLFIISRGRVIAKTELLDDGEFPVYSSQTENKGILGYINTYDFDTDLITWTTDGVNAGTVFRRAGKFSCTNICGTLIPKNTNKTSLDYFGYAIAESTQHNKRIDTNGAKIMSNEMAVIHIIEPPTKAEQTAIAQYLDKKTNTIDAITTNIGKQIDHLKELRKTLINDVVTGKIKVTPNN